MRFHWPWQIAEKMLPRSVTASRLLRHGFHISQIHSRHRVILKTGEFWTQQSGFGRPEERHNRGVGLGKYFLCLIIQFDSLFLALLARGLLQQFVIARIFPAAM